MIISPPPQPLTSHFIKLTPPSDLVSWYKRAITSYLNEHEGTLSVFTVNNVVQQFSPPGTRGSRKRDIEAASQALEQLMSEGVLCRHEVEGEIRYAND